MTSNLKILIIGSGDIGTAVASALEDKGHAVTALRRNPPSEHTIKFVQADITQRESLEKLDMDFSYVLFIAAPDRRSEEAYRDLYDVGLINALQRFNESMFIFISSTAVYGQSEGEWLDEEAETEPTNFRGKILLKAEDAVLSQNEKNIVIRFSGIYGRGENHILAKLKKEQEIQFEPPYFTNRIHRDDCIGVVLFLLEKSYHDSLPNRLYLATDKNPMSLYELASHIAKQNALPFPQKQTLDIHANQNKRLSSRRLEALGYQFKYPAYKV